MQSFSASQLGLTLVQSILPGVDAGATVKYVRGTVRVGTDDVASDTVPADRPVHRDLPRAARFVLVQPKDEKEAERSEIWRPQRPRPILQIKDYRGRRVILFEVNGTPAS